MPSTVNFASLSADVSNYLERGGSTLTDLTVATQIPRLINAAERNIMQFLKLQGQIEALVAAPNGLVAGVAVLPKPDRWRETVSINYGAGTAGNSRTSLFPRSYEYCRAYWPDDTQTAPPEIYADYDLAHWLIAPTPDQTYPAEFILYMQPPLLDGSNESNFFSNYTPNLLLYETMKQSALFLKNFQDVATWEAEVNKQLASLNGQDLQKILDRAAQRKMA